MSWESQSLVSFMLNGLKDDSTCGEADPGYPRREEGGVNLKVGGATCYFSHFSRKLYEIEKDQTERGSHRFANVTSRSVNEFKYLGSPITKII